MQVFGIAQKDINDANASGNGQASVYAQRYRHFRLVSRPDYALYRPQILIAEHKLFALFERMARRLTHDAFYALPSIVEQEASSSSKVVRR